MAKTMTGAVFKGDGKLVLEQRPIPKIQDPNDVIRLQFRADFGVSREHQPPRRRCCGGGSEAHVDGQERCRFEPPLPRVAGRQ